jgi:hypothetical protein
MLKVAILNHKLAGWKEVAPLKLIKLLDTFKALIHSVETKESLKPFTRNKQKADATTTARGFHPTIASATADREFVQCWMFRLPRAESP